MKGAIISSIITGIFTFGATYFGVQKRFLDEIKQLKAEVVKAEMIAKSSSKSARNLTLALKDKQNTIEKLESDFHQLQEKYNILIEPKKGAYFIVDIFDNASHLNEKLKINDQIEVKLTASSLYCKILRVIQRGVLIRISGCKKYYTENAARLENDETTFLLLKDVPFKFIFSNKGCEDGEFPDETVDWEEIVLLLKDYNVEAQQLKLQYKRRLWK
jgi:hypothetical protein